MTANNGIPFPELYKPHPVKWTENNTGWEQEISGDRQRSPEIAFAETRQPFGFIPVSGVWYITGPEDIY